MSGFDVVTSYRVSTAGEHVIQPYRELSRKHYRWRWLAWLCRGPKFGFGKLRPGQFAFWRAEIVPCDSRYSPNGRDAARGSGRSPSSGGARKRNRPDTPTPPTQAA